MIKARPHKTRIAALGAVIALLAAPQASFASGETLRHATTEMLFAPIDLILSPVTAGVALVQNLRDIDDTMAVRVAYAVPGYFWLAGLHVGSSVLRGIGGALEFVPGLILLGFPDQDLDPLFSPVERGAALIEVYNPLNEAEGAAYDIIRYAPVVQIFTVSPRVGINYTASEY